MKNLLRQINVFSACSEVRAVGLSIWSCPQFIFVIMGVVIIGSILLTYSISQQYLEASVLIYIVVFMTVFLFIVSYLIVHAFERVVYISRLEAKRAEELLKLKDQFVYIAAHELRTPANAIKWGLKLLDDATDIVSKDTKEVLNIIRESNDRLILLVNDVLEAARIEGTGTTRLNLTPVSAQDAMAAAVSELTSAASARGVVVESTIPGRLPKVSADPLRIKEVFVNLLSNAIKYSDEKGGHVTISARIEGRELLVSITNNGAGIPMTDQKHIFEKFWRKNEGGEGTGLGLFIVKELMARMAGRIFFTSETGITTFSTAFQVAG